MPQSRRERLRTEAVRDIKAAAVRQLHEVGAERVSVRAVAAEVGLSSAGIYRYYASREELLTALIADAFEDLARVVAAARDAEAGAADRLVAAALAFRRWALGNRPEFALIYGGPLTGYEAPAGGVTTMAARQVGAAFADPLLHAWREGLIQAADAGEAEGRAVAGFRDRLDPDLPASLVVVFVRLWGRMHGLVALEVFGHMPFLDPDGEHLLRQAIVDDLRRAGLTGPDGTAPP